MKVQEFCHFQQEQQFDLLKQWGIFLMTRSTNADWVALFSLDSFYVELVQKPDSNPLQLLRSFEDTNELAPYLEQINITSILRD